MKRNIAIQFYLFAFFIVLISPNKINAQSYCSPINIGGNSSFYVSNVTFGDINNSSNNTANSYTYYNSLSTSVVKESTYSSSVTFAMDNYNEATVRVWVDFNNDGDFLDSGEQTYSFTGSAPTSSSGITKTFQILIPATATAANTRMRVAIRRGNTIDPCNLAYQVGEVEDYNINIKPSPTPPTAVCNNSINISLDVSGNASITTADINNNSYDDYDDVNDLILSLDNYNFTCDDISNPVTVTLTVQDSDGLTDTCTTTVNVSAYSGSFQSPNLEDITTFCSYTAEAPIMNYQCGQQIIATTSDTTTFSSVGSYSIDWVFDNGTTTATSTQNITITNPATPTSVNITNINETSAKVNWNSSESGLFRIRYRLNGLTDPWTETTSSSTSKTITGLDDGLQYQVQVKVESNCGTYTSSTLFTTTQVQYCTSNVNINKSNQYYISNVNIGNINNTTPSNDNVYKYFNNMSTNLVVGETFSGTITYSRAGYNTTALVVWIDYNNDGDFEDAGEEVLSITNPGNVNTVFNIPLNILVPETATLGKTRLRVGLAQNGTPTSACNFDYRNGEIEDYDVYLNLPDNTLFESAMITQVYHYGVSERWIEVTNTNTTETIPANTLALALFKNTSGDQTGVTPSATFLINTELSPGESTLIKSSNSTLSAYLGTAIENTAITDFNDANDILIVTKKTDNSAWKNRFDIISNISNNTSYIRSDEVTTYKNTYTSSEWISFIDDALSPTTSPPERHPHAPLISEVINGNSNSNVKLGLHRINKTIRTGSVWSNGYPDRSRSVLINENLSQSVRFSARKLEIANSSKLLINNELLVVSNNIKINSSGQIRLAGTSQLIQTHTGSKNITGTGKLYIDQNSTVPSIYRYNYMSSPVATSGLSNYTLLNVMKDGTTPTSMTSVPKSINFIEGYDGSFANSPSGPIDIAEYWIYTFDNNGSDYNYIHKYKNGIINPGKGYLFKGPGRPQNYTYSGTPNDGSYNYSISGNKNVLLGNPYASALNSKKFIEDNLDSTTGTIYFWEHAGETNSSGAVGHYSSAYVGGYAARNISMGISAMNVSGNSTVKNVSFINLEAETALLENGAIKEGNGVKLDTLTAMITYKTLKIGQDLDTLRIVYKSNTNKSIELYLNSTLKKTTVFPTSASYDTIKIPLNVLKLDTLKLKSIDTTYINIDKVIFRQVFQYTEPKQYIPIAQGFFAQSDSDGGAIIFNNSQREFITEGENSVLLRSSKKKNNKVTSTLQNNSLQILKLGMDYKGSNNTILHRQLGISFKENNSFAFDKGYDSEIFDLNETDMYWQFDDIPNQKLIITGVQEINYDLEIPLKVVVNYTGEVSFMIDESQNIGKTAIYLIDKVEGVSYKLSSKKEISINAGEYTDRFYIVFKENSLSTDDVVLNDKKIFFDSSRNEIVINNLSDAILKKVELYNILGQKTQSWNKIENQQENRFLVNKAPTNIYFVRVKTNKGTLSKKIIIN